MTLYDARGNPLETKKLKGDQSSPTLSGIRSWHHFSMFRAVSPTRMAKALNGGARGNIVEIAQIYADMEEKDTHIYSEMAKRKSAVAGLEWEVAPAGDDARSVDIAADVTAQLKGLNLSDLLSDLMDGIGKGFSACELDWDISAGGAKVSGYTHALQNWFVYHPERPELRLNNGSPEGEELWAYKWLLHTPKVKSGSPYRDSLFRVLAWLYLIRNYSLKAWGIFIDSYGLPLRIGYFEAGATKEEQEVLSQGLANIAQDCSAVLPEGMKIDIIDQATGRNYSTPHERILKYTEAAISIAITGSTLTSSSGDGAGSYALGKIHNLVRADIRNKDISQIQPTIDHQLIRPIVDLNHGPQQAYPSFHIIKPDTEDKGKEASTIQTLANAGFRDIPLSWIRKKFHIPEPKDGEQTLADLVNQVAQPAQDQDTAVNSRRRGILETNKVSKAKEAQEVVDALKEDVTPYLAQMSEDMVKGMVEAVMEARDFNDARARLNKRYGEVNTEEFVQLMARSSFVSTLFGGATGKD